LSDINLNNNNINIDSFYEGQQALIFNTKYNDVLSNQISFSINLNDSVLIGDLNNDNEINVVDVIIIVNIILNEEFDSLADLNQDGTINISDIILLINIILN